MYIGPAPCSSTVPVDPPWVSHQGVENHNLLLWIEGTCNQLDELLQLNRDSS